MVQRKFIFTAYPSKFNRELHTEIVEFDEDRSDSEIHICFIDWIGDGNGDYEEIKDE